MFFCTSKKVFSSVLQTNKSQQAGNQETNIPHNGCVILLMLCYKKLSTLFITYNKKWQKHMAASPSKVTLDQNICTAFVSLQYHYYFMNTT